MREVTGIIRPGPRLNDTKSVINLCNPKLDLSGTEWIQERCSGEFGKVSGWLPSGYEHYTQICPPAWQQPVEPREPTLIKQPSGTVFEQELDAITWAQVAELYDTQITPYTRFSELLPTGWDGRVVEPGKVYPPLEGTPTAAMMDAVTDAVLTFSGSHSDCMIAVWEGHLPNADRERLREIGCAKLDCFSQGGHYVLEGKLWQVLSFTRHFLPEDPICASSASGYIPQAIWPASGEWFYAIPFDWISTFFGGPQILVSKLMADARVECQPVAYDAEYI